MHKNYLAFIGTIVRFYNLWTQVYFQTFWPASVCGSVAQWLVCWTRDQHVAGSNPGRGACEQRPWASRSRSRACHQAVYFGVDVSWEGNRRSGVAPAIRHRQVLYFRPRAQGHTRKLSIPSTPQLQYDRLTFYLTVQRIESSTHLFFKTCFSK